MLEIALRTISKRKVVLSSFSSTPLQLCPCSWRLRARPRTSASITAHLSLGGFRLSARADKWRVTVLLTLTDLDF